MKTVLITGCSSGYGRETARYFLEKGWKVIATMRTPDVDVFPSSENLIVLPLDVTQPASITNVAEKCGSTVDVLVNNAGIGLFGAFEETPMAIVKEVFGTNTFGVMATVQAFLPYFRKRKTGIIINVTSTVTQLPMPLVAIYTASKTAIEGFSTSVAHELSAFNIGIKVVQPGYGPTTRFADNSSQRMQDLINEAYAPYAQSVLGQFSNAPFHTTESDVAEAIWKAANDTSKQIHFPAGADAIALANQ